MFMLFPPLFSDRSVCSVLRLNTADHVLEHAPSFTLGPCALVLNLWHILRVLATTQALSQINRINHKHDKFGLRAGHLPHPTPKMARVSPDGAFAGPMNVMWPATMAG
jgi:hypothetical protein